MNTNEAFCKAVKTICARDPRYAEDAYLYLMEALSGAIQEMRQETGHARQLTGAELVNTLREHIRYDFAPMGWTLLNEWGITTTDDFGEIVFNLIAEKQLSKEPDDKKSHFHDLYDFKKEFLDYYRPEPSVKQ